MQFSTTKISQRENINRKRTDFMHLPSPERYSRMVKKATPSSPTFKNCFFAFLVGGSICTLGQILSFLYLRLGADEKTSAAFVSISLIFIAAVFTSVGCYDKLAKHAGAGTLVPITGFANSIAAPAIEFKTEGFILGVGAKMFTIAGPVIVYGVSASVIYGIIYWITTLF